MDIRASISLLQATRPRITMGDLVGLPHPSAAFEFNDHDKWFFSVRDDSSMTDGSLLEGNLICVTADSPLKAEQLAQDGLLTSIQHFAAYLGTGPQISAETRPANQ